MSLNLYDSQTKQLTPLAGNARNPVQGATSSANGVSGLVPTPLAGDQDKYLKGDGTWGVVEAGGAGHIIVDSDGTEYTQRSNLVIENGWLEDDSTNDATVVHSTNFEGTKAEWDLLSLQEKAKYKTVDFSGGFNTDGTADDISYDNTTSGLTATDVQDAIDEVVSGVDTVDGETQSGNLTIGATSITLNFSKVTIGADTLVDPYTSVYGVNPKAITTTANSVTLTFDAQDVAVGVKVHVRN